MSTAQVFYDSANEVATVRNVWAVNGSATDPTTVTFRVTPPSGTAVDYTYAAAEVTRNATGDYSKGVPSGENGIWKCELIGTGAASDVEVVHWRAWGVGAHLYVTPEDLKSRFGIALSDSRDDYEIIGVVRAASRRIESYCGLPRGRGFWRDAAVTTRTFTADSCSSVRVPEGISTLTGLVVATDEDGDNTYERTLTVDTDYLVKPDNALVDGWPITEIVLADNYSFPVHANRRAGVQVTARFGWPAVPDDVREAALILSHRLFKRKETSSGVLGFDGGGVTVRLARTDPDVAELLAPYVRYAVA